MSRLYCVLLSSFHPGYGNAMNVKRTVRGYAQAGFAGERRLVVVSGGQRICISWVGLQVRVWHLVVVRKHKCEHKLKKQNSNGWTNHCVSFCFIKATCALKHPLATTRHSHRGSSGSQILRPCEGQAGGWTRGGCLTHSSRS